MRINNEYDLWWAMVPGVLGVKTMEIAGAVGDTEKLFKMDRDELLGIKGIGDRAAQYIINRRNSWNYEQSLELLHRNNIRFIPYYSEEYPKRLLRIKDYPFALFVIGNLPEDDVPSVAVIGARDCSEYGRKVASYFGEGLASCGINVISGMALGIDAISQQSAISSGGNSYAVLGSGPDVCYPPSNYKIYEHIKTNGGIISEYGPNTEAVSWHFPARNRIISGLADILLVVEAKEKSGTHITVDMALEQGRDIMVVPGRITDPMSVGCLKLINEGAMCAISVEDVLKILQEKYGNTAKTKQLQGKVTKEEIKFNLESTEKLVYSCFDLYPKSLEEALIDSGLGDREVFQAVVNLEIRGLISEVSKGYYVKINT